MTALTVLAVGATGSIGRHVVTEAAAAGHRVRALVRSRERAALLPAGTDVVIGDVTRPETLTAALEGVDAVVLTHGTDGQGKVGARTVDYEGVRNVLDAIGDRTVRIALMTAIGVTDRAGHYNQTTHAHDWGRSTVSPTSTTCRSTTSPRPFRPRSQLRSQE